MEFPALGWRQRRSSLRAAPESSSLTATHHKQPYHLVLNSLNATKPHGKDLSAAFKHAQIVDIAVANAGVSEERNYFDDTFDEQGNLLEPSRAVIDVNLVGTFNFCKLALSLMRRRGVGGSIVITSSATAYAPEHSLPVYSACKLAVSSCNGAFMFERDRLTVPISAASGSRKVSPRCHPEG